MDAFPLRRLLCTASLLLAAALAPARAAPPAPVEMTGGSASATEPEAAAPLPGEKQVACGLYMSGAWTFTLNANTNVANVTLAAINNDAFGCANPTGTLRLELWAVTTANLPAVRGGGFFGQRVAVFPPAGQLYAGFSFINNNGTAPYIPPVYGSYWIVLSLSEFSPGCGNADNFCTTDNLVSNNMVTIGNNTLTVSKAGTGSGTVTSSPGGIDCGGNCQWGFFGGNSVTLTATPANGSSFAGWGGACAGTGQCIVSMSAARSVTATFNLLPPALNTLTVSKTGQGTVTSNPSGINCGATCSTNFFSPTAVTLTANADPGWVFSGWSGACAGTGTCQVTMDAPRSAHATFTQVVIAARRGDVNGDGKADLFWREPAPGVGLSWWTMNGNASTGANYYQVSPEWQVADVADLSGDGKADMIWRRASDGATYLWTLNGLVPASFFDLGILNPAQWSLVGAADLSGDGKADIVWRNADGTIYLWIMNGGVISSQGVLGNPGSQWQVIDLADMNGDGKADLVFRHSTTGQVYFWYGNGLAVGGAGSPGGLDPAQWQLLAAADFSGDGKADLLWRSTAGDTWVWVTNGAMASIGNPGLAWSVKSVGDFDGDGKADLLWRHTDGTTYLWKMNGAAVSAFQPVANPGGAWQVVVP
jgi:hypothetical protein